MASIPISLMFMSIGPSEQRGGKRRELRSQKMTDSFTLWGMSTPFQLVVFLSGLAAPSSAFQLTAFQFITVTG